MVMEVEPVVKTRYQCLYCRRSFASKSYAMGHAKQCGRNPDVRACLTCAHYVRTPCCDVGSDNCGCMGRSDCRADAFVSQQEDYTDSDCPSWAMGPKAVEAW